MSGIITQNDLHTLYRNHLHLLRDTDNGLRVLLLTPHAGVARVEVWRTESRSRHIALWRKVGTERATREDLAFVEAIIERAPRR